MVWNVVSAQKWDFTA